MTDIKLNYDDITIVPEVLTDIESRSECDPYTEDGYLPIFASPMTSVVSFDNVKDFNNARIMCVIPRSYSLNDRLMYMFSTNGNVNFVSFSLKEAEDVFLINSDAERYNLMRRFMIGASEIENLDDIKYPFRMCIDLANGHMRKLLDVVKGIKKMWGGSIEIMTGNIANPKTYEEYEKAGVDFCRLSVGTGSVCSTSSNVGVHYSIFSLLSEVYEIKKKINGKCKIIADGGIKGFRDIQKALIYADYVMIGGLFNKAIESAGKTTYGKSYFNIRGYKILRPFKTLFTYGKEIKRKDFESVYKRVKSGKLTVFKELFGQSTKIAQAIVASANSQTLKSLKTSEGLFKYQKVEYTLKGWSDNETDFLRSAMSYTDSKTLDDFKESQWIQITKRAYNE